LFCSWRAVWGDEEITTKRDIIKVMMAAEKKIQVTAVRIQKGKEPFRIPAHGVLRF